MLYKRQVYKMNPCPAKELAPLKTILTQKKPWTA